jgi:hypothetical protein
MPKYQGESEDSTASKKERMKIKKKKEERNAPPVRRGLNPPPVVIKLAFPKKRKPKPPKWKIPLLERLWQEQHGERGHESK